MLFIMVPYQKRPWRSHLPSLERFFGLSFSGAQKRVVPPLAGSKKSMPVWEAMISPPFAAHRDGRDHLRQGPARMRAAGGVPALDFLGRHIGPIERVLARMPAGTFAQQILCLEHAFRSRHRFLLSIPTGSHLQRRTAVKYEGADLAARPFEHVLARIDYAAAASRREIFSMRIVGSTGFSTQSLTDMARSAIRLSCASAAWPVTMMVGGGLPCLRSSS